MNVKTEGLNIRGEQREKAVAAEALKTVFLCKRIFIFSHST